MRRSPGCARSRACELGPGSMGVSSTRAVVESILAE
jgi:hypothetical protein